jgi:competence protein CoiA
MLTARRQSDGQTVTADLERKANAPFYCLTCGDQVILKTSKNRVSYFAHRYPLGRHYGDNESDEHRRCKLEIFAALKRTQGVEDVRLECALGEVRPDVSARINGVPVAIEVQISDLSLETITQRTIEYARKGIYVLWLLQWTPKLAAPRYSPRLWERWIHACYFGRVYYWIEGLSVTYYEFEPSFKSIPKSSWYSPKGEKKIGGGYSRKSKRYRTAVRGRTFNLVTDFAPKQRYWWEGNGIKVPDAKLYCTK